MTTTATYVAACHAVGYQHPDLTAHAGQIFEWYGGDDGLDLAVLDADCATLRAASAAADQAVRVSRDGLAAAAAAWGGESGSVAGEFIQRHCAAAAAVADSLRAAALSCEALRDGLWRAVDEKVGAAVSIDDRRAGERPAWLAAAATVVGGGAAREQAIDVVAHQVTPYVDADIRTDWLSAMRAAASSATDAYEDALRQLNSSPTPHFEVPGIFGGPPPLMAAPASPHTTPAGAASMVSPSTAPAPPPSVGEPGPPASPASSLPANTPAAQPLPTPPPGEPPVPPALGAPPSAAMPTMPDVGGGLSGLVGQLADALGGMFDSMPDNAVDNGLPELDDPADEHEPEDIPEPEDAVPEDDPLVEESEPAGRPAEVPPPTPEAEAVEAEPPSPPQPAAAPPPAPPPPVGEESDDQTPCEIAADELPQVGQ
ncbi:hypothetical protein [Mycolicibacterium rhodesiae]|uniref:hypothetical protein n=1 Tax=Mycolicibacterium rhodesiae TaxID=36814 RepID=UPI001055B762|nr:hypothetical protein [Mycolicibacterium rhodesiae]MCV7347320.1 hypothetical protein [Mycolicibacterium rhodesiae]